MAIPKAGEPGYQPKKVFGNPNKNYIDPGPEAASDQSISSTKASTDFASTDPTEELDDILSIAAEQDRQHFPQLNNHSPLQIASIIRSLPTRIDTTLYEYATEKGSLQGLLSDWDTKDSQLREEIEELNLLAKPHLSESAEYLYLSDNPIESMILNSDPPRSRFGESKHMTEDVEDEIVNHIVEELSYKLKTPDIMHPNIDHLDYITESPETFLNPRRLGYHHKDRDTESVKKFQAEVIRKVTTMMREQYDGNAMMEEDFIEAFDTYYYSYRDAALNSMKDDELYRMYIDAGCDPDKEYEDPESRYQMTSISRYAQKFVQADISRMIDDLTYRRMTLIREAVGKRR